MVGESGRGKSTLAKLIIKIETIAAVSASRIYYLFYNF
ncbi:hypothetical protein I7822_07005 [Metabacillus sp. BG109]|uniref:ABC transporter domain-containing protein n=1 Tax=Metabacillus bambusae TaxID=2795218 RepID=A0ABS3MZT6_9BACI|nr:hypothetical protein [Metabacillus bambusae]